MNTPAKNAEMLAATVSFRLSEEECRTLSAHASRENRTVSNLVRMLLRNVLQQRA